LDEQPNFFTIGSNPIEVAFVIGCGLYRGHDRTELAAAVGGHATAARKDQAELTVFRQAQRPPARPPARSLMEVRPVEIRVPRARLTTAGRQDQRVEEQDAAGPISGAREPLMR